MFEVSHPIWEEQVAQRKKKYDDFYSMIMVREHKITKNSTKQNFS